MSGKATGSSRRHKKKSEKFKGQRAGMTRTEWAAFKKLHHLPKIVIGSAWKSLLK